MDRGNSAQAPSVEDVDGRARALLGARAGQTPRLGADRGRTRGRPCLPRCAGSRPRGHAGGHDRSQRSEHPRQHRASSGATACRAQSRRGSRVLTQSSTHPTVPDTCASITGTSMCRRGRWRGRRSGDRFWTIVRGMSKPFRSGRHPWWCSGDNKAESIVRLDAECLGLRVRLSSGERVTMPLGQMTFVMRFPREA